MDELPVSAYLPSLAAARAAGVDLPPGDPVEERRLAALIVRARMLRREALDVETAGPAASIARLPRDAQPPPPQGFAHQTYMSLIETIGPAPCPSCQSAMSALCVRCAGTGKVTRALVRQWNDTPLSSTETYVPSQVSFVPALFSFEAHLEQVTGGEPPEALRCHDLRTRTEGSAYRGGGRERAPDFHGHDFGDALEKARSAVAAMTLGKIVMQDVKAYAWPFLWLAYDDHTGTSRRDLALFADPAGALQVFAKDV